MKVINLICGIAAFLNVIFFASDWYAGTPASGIVWFIGILASLEWGCKWLNEALRA